MKIRLLVAGISGVILCCEAQIAFAQSSVTLYGIADTSVRYLTNSDRKNNSQVAMGAGPITSSRWGLKGSEDLGSGLQAIFRLENGFKLWNGQLQSSNTIFNRMAYVGLSSARYGILTFGRNNTPLFDQLSNVFDPLTVGNYDQDGWLPSSLGYQLRANNSIKYKGQFGGLTAEALYSFGGVAGSLGASSLYGFNASYAFSSLSLDLGYQQASDGANNKDRVINAAAVYSFSSVKAYAGWFHSQDNTGTVDILMGAANSPAASWAPKTKTNRIDDGFYVGATWQAMTPLLITAAAYYDKSRNALNNDDRTLGRGIRYSGVLVAEYSFSKRTEVYGTVDFIRGTGAATSDFAGRNNQTGVGMGVRTLF